jgi:hypothetical protein
MSNHLDMLEALAKDDDNAARDIGKRGPGRDWSWLKWVLWLAASGLLHGGVWAARGLLSRRKREKLRDLYVGVTVVGGNASFLVAYSVAGSADKTEVVETEVRGCKKYTMECEEKVTGGVHTWRRVRFSLVDRSDGVSGGRIELPVTSLENSGSRPAEMDNEMWRILEQAKKSRGFQKWLKIIVNKSGQEENVAIKEEEEQADDTSDDGRKRISGTSDDEDEEGEGYDSR